MIERLKFIVNRLREKPWIRPLPACPISIVFVTNDYDDDTGLFALFILTVITFTLVILTFVRWVDSIARLGRLGTIVDKAVAATDRALQRRRRAPALGCRPATSDASSWDPVVSPRIGYVQRVDAMDLPADVEIVRSLAGFAE